MYLISQLFLLDCREMKGREFLILLSPEKSQQESHMCIHTQYCEVDLHLHKQILPTSKRLKSKVCERSLFCCAQSDFVAP